jgi:hypothetical protein
MTQDEIIELAKQSDLGFLLGDSWLMHHEIEYFAKLVAEKEREACAKEADKRLHDYTMLTSNPPQSGAAWSIASAIRTRGQA